VAIQGSLLDTSPNPAPRPLGDDHERVQLGLGAWLDLERGWIARSDLLFERLLDGVPWQAERRRMYDHMVDVPRLVRFYDECEALPDPVLEQVKSVLSVHYGSESGDPFTTAGLCLYRDGRDSVAWHGDRIGRGSTEDTTVAIVSLGNPRRFLVRPRGGGAAMRYELGNGDLLVMGGSFQRTWEHSIPKTNRAVGPRISVQFRPRDVR